MKITYLNRIGRSHIYDNKPCDDAIYISPSSDVVCVADGVSNSSHGGVGAKSLVNNIGHYVSRPAVKTLLENGSPDEIRHNICPVIEKVINQLCEEYNANADDFASTLLVAVRTSDNHITLLHAGDGAIFGQPRTDQESASIISMPDNASNGAVYPAHDSLQKERMRVIRICEDDYNAIALGTDGFSDSYLNPKVDFFDTYGLSAAMATKNNNELNELIEERHIAYNRISDDISCVIIHLHETEAKCEYTAPSATSCDDKPQVVINNSKISREKSRYKKGKKYTRKGYDYITKLLTAAVAFMFAIFCVIALFKSSREIDALKEENTSQSETINILTSQIDEANNKLGALEQALAEHKELCTPQPDPSTDSESAPSTDDEPDLPDAEEVEANQTQ